MNPYRPIPVATPTLMLELDGGLAFGGHTLIGETTLDLVYAARGIAGLDVIVEGNTLRFNWHDNLSHSVSCSTFTSEATQ